MQIDDVTPPFKAFVSDLLQRKARDPSSFCLSIADADEMFWKAIVPGYGGHRNVSMFKYVESSLRMFDVYSQVVDQALAGFDNVGHVLDFGSGYGRITRSLVQYLPPSRIWVCDLYTHAISWQAETFGVNAVVSVGDPDRLGLPQRFSVVFVGSVFSHLPSALFDRWLARLYRLLEPRGVLVFSVHDEAMLPEGETLDAEGFLYLRWSESDSLGADLYGLSYVSERRVASAIATCDPSRRVRYKRFVKGLYENQDLYVVAGEEVDLDALTLASSPLGGFDGVTPIASGGLRCVGWGVDPNPGHQLTSCEAYDGDRRVASAVPVANNVAAMKYFPGLSNMPVTWSIDVGPEHCRPDAVLRVELRSSCGTVAYAYTMPDEELRWAAVKENPLEAPHT